MNTYNDNLRSTVLSTLGTLEQEIKKADSTTNTAMFTLYYAEGATINAKEQLDKAEAQESLRSNTKQKAVENNNLGNNALATANQANTLVQQAVTNTSVGAANVQVAANAILQLAGDMGNILNIAMAADFGSEIQVQAKTANMYISSTAYQAEQASQYAMEAAIATSGVSASTVQTTASGAAAAIGNLLSVTSTDYDTIAQVVMADNAALATYSANAKLAKGVYKDATTEQSAVKEAYVESSEQLNLGLVASTVAGKESTDFTVSFNWLTSPFPELVPTSPTQSSDPNFMPLHYPMPYPVSDYYLFMVNEAQKNTFALSDAEDIVTRLMTDRYIDLANSLKPPMDDHFSQTFSIPQLQLRDTGGVPIEAGKRYVVFVMAKYAETYKKKLNSYEDFLSAPSASFYFTNMLATANYVDDKKSATAAATDSTVADTNEAAARPKADLPPKPTSFNITVKEKVSLLVEARPDYRCIFLPVKQLPIESLPITDKPAFIFNTTIAAQVSAANYTLAQPITSPIKDLPNFSSVESARQKMEKAHKDTTDPLAGAIKSADTAAKAVVELAGARPKAKAAEAQLTDDHTNAEGTASAASTGDAAAVKKTALEAAAAAQNEAAAVAKSAKKEANDAVGDAQKASSAAAVFAAFAETVSDVFEVFDSLSEIAAAVTADEVRSAAGKAVKGVHQANSAAATAMAAAGTDAGLLSVAKLVAAMASSLATESLYVTKTYNVTVSNATTDNFGNELHATEQYLPMILSISDEAQSALNPTYTSNMAACPEMPVTLPKA